MNKHHSFFQEGKNMMRVTQETWLEIHVAIKWKCTTQTVKNNDHTLSFILTLTPHYSHVIQANPQWLNINHSHLNRERPLRPPSTTAVLDNPYIAMSS